MERPMSIGFVDETIPVVHGDVHLVAEDDDATTEQGTERIERGRRQLPPPVQQLRYADAGPRVVDEQMRLPSFVETCPHVRDQIIPLNGGRFNVDHYLRVLRAKAVLDVSIAMALTVRAE